MKVSLFTEVQCAAGSSPVQRLDEFLAQAELADNLGYRGFWIAELHFQPEFSVLSAPYVVLGAASQRTRRLRLGVAVNTVAVHHPLQLAEQAAMLDLLSQGRMEFAAGGGHPHSRAYEGFGIAHEKTRAILEESLKVIQHAWTDQALTFDGEFFHIPEVTVNPKPIQKPHPSIHIAASSSDGVQAAARMNFNLFLPIHTRSREQLLALSRNYWEDLRINGHDPARRELGLLVPLHVASTRSEAERRSEEGIMNYYRIIGAMRRNYIDWMTRQGNTLPERLAKVSAGDGLTFERVCSEHAVIGDSSEVTARLQQLSEETGANHILAWMNIGSVSHGHVVESMQRFAGEVLPRLQSYSPRAEFKASPT
jgi:alkanesulfonate monooxygenase SsuD/methylene tetrahydromethanopterin reductase-like flavin-dependent oxidoreductase (luciferase family)